MSNSLNDINHWKGSFGLLPIHLDQAKFDPRYIMLNGGIGDFCIQFGKLNKSDNVVFSNSWSTNTTNYLIVKRNGIELLNWKTRKKEEFSKSVLDNNFNKFYDYIYKSSYGTSEDIVPFILDIFKQFRNLTFEKQDPKNALNLLFLLIASLDKSVDKINLDKWSIPELKIPKDFHIYCDKLKNGINGLKPDLDLLLRHSAGALFQEAQKEVLFFDSQLDLFGEVSNHLIYKNKNYSSVHYTPSFISRTIVEQCLQDLDLKKKSLRIIDPACGSGEFLIEILKQLKERKYTGKVKLIGYDNSNMAVNATKFLLKYEKNRIWKSKLSYEVNYVEDSLREDWGTRNDLVLMNPPFFSWELLKNDLYKESVKETLGEVFEKKPNQASAFFFKAFNSINSKGKVGCVMPASILTSDSYQKLREDIQSKYSLSLIGKLGNFVFEDALTDVAIIIGSKLNSTFDGNTKVLWSRNESGIVKTALRELRKIEYTNKMTSSNQDFSIYDPISFPFFTNNWKVLSFKENEFLKSIKRFAAEDKMTFVKNLFDVKQGINSGKNKIFKISKEEFDSLPKNEKEFFKPVVDNKAIEKCSINKSSFIWFPYDLNGITIKTEKGLKKNVPIFYKTLSKFKKELSDRPRKGENKWWYLGEHRAWLLKPEPRLVSTRFGNSSSFAFDSEGEFVVENGSAWLPKRKFELNQYYFYLALFSSSIFDQLLSIYSKQLSGGKWYDLGKKYSQEIPIPNIFKDNVKNLAVTQKIIEIGEGLHKGNYFLRTNTDSIISEYFYPELM